MKKRDSHRLWAIALLVLLAIVPSLLATSCGRNAGEGETASTGKAAKILRFTAAWPPQSVDPGVGQDNVSTLLFANIYDTLVTPNPNGGVTSALATSWDVSSDGLTYTFNLRSGVKFHNGDKLTSEDVVFSLKRLLDMGQGYAYLFSPVVEEVQAKGSNKVVIKLKEPFGPFVNAVANLYILNAKEVTKNIAKPGDYGDKGDYGKAWLVTHDAGSGPYRIAEMNLAEHLVAERFRDYWQPFDKQNPDEFTLVGTNEPVTTRVMMTNRELEITDHWQSEENYQAMAKIPGVEIAQFTSGGILTLQLNTKRPPTDDVHVRRALAYIVDYDQVIQAVYPGSKQPIGPVSSVFVAHKKDLHQFKLDLEKAKEEIKQSKYYGKLDQYPVDVCYPAEWVAVDKIGLLFQSGAAKIGVKVRIAKRPWAKMVADVSTKETTPHADLVTVVPHYPEAGSPLSRYLSSNSGSWEHMEWLQDSKIDGMVKDALATLNVEERTKKYYAIQELLVDMCPDIWLVEVNEKHAYQAGYVEWGLIERIKAGGRSIPAEGQNLSMRDIKVFPEKKPKQ
jgi:peptide/nickel transport system substrate-binding protein